MPEPLTPDEVNARHAESTPSGSSYHAGDPEMGDLPHRVRPDADGRYTVDVHVTPDGHARIGNRLYTPEEFADILRRNADYDGRPVRLIGCDASSNDFAHRLSRELDTEVMAPTKPAWTDSHGLTYPQVDFHDGPALLFQQVPEETPGKNRLHLDLAPVGRDQRAEVERLVMLGAKVLDDPADDPWIVLADPEGNEFCVLPPR